MSNQTSKWRKLSAEGLCPAPDRLWKLIQRADLPSLLCRDPAILAAFNIQRGDPLRKAELEARILANQSQAEIATKMTLALETVIEFEDFFFCVRPRLEMTSWIMHEVIRRSPTDELSAGDVGIFWRSIAFQYGPVALETYLAAVDTETLRSKGLDAYWQRETSLDPELKLFVLTERLPHPRTPEEQVRRLMLLNELFALQETQAEDFLSPLTLDLELLCEPDNSVAQGESDSLEAIDLLDDMVTSRNGNQQAVLQSQAM